jgi:diguanylate cyclase (GGDEF)-like protein
MMLAITTDFIIIKLFNHTASWQQELIQAGLIPLFIAPLLSWYPFGLLHKFERLEREMSRIATYDDLTGLKTRRAFFAGSEAIHQLSLRNKSGYCLMVIDLDHFKRINDNFGHAGGDKVLAAFGQIANQLLRKSDVLGRLGGEEFCFLLPEMSLTKAEMLAIRLQAKIKDTRINHNGRDIRFSASIGISAHHHGIECKLSEIINQADEALYCAKNNGRNRITLYAPLKAA